MELAELHRVVSINRRFSDIDNSLSNKAGTIDSLRRAITSAEEGLVDFDKVIENLSRLLIAYMKKSGLKNVVDIFVDKKFTPHFRGISYYETPSGGVRTITSIGSFLIRLLYLLGKGGNVPTFLMIDTLGQNIGRYKRDEDSEATDPAVYEKIYEQIAGVVEFARSKNKISQVIIVDNDSPLFLQNNGNFHLVKRFSKDSPEFERGLINDAGTQ
jgi:AAA+ ATPase superfamily predicted ATPase